MTRSDATVFAAEVRQLLAELDHVERAALQLIYFTGLSQREAAVALDLEPQTLTACLVRGMRQLAARFTEGTA